VLPIVFDAFEQGSNSITHEFGGLGLGLAISKALVEAHRGAISVASEGKNRGATFTLDLPVDEAMTLAPETKKANAERNTLALRLLVIEDNEDTGLAMRLLLQRHGYRVEVVRTLHDALTCYKQLTFDAVISDIGLPDGTGLDLIQKINQIRPVPAVALSGFGMESDIQKSLEAGFKAHLTKPVDFAQLHDTLQRITEPQPAPVE